MPIIPFKILFLNFDNKTGKATFKRLLDITGAEALEFSPDCKLLYYKRMSGMYQLNLTAPDSLSMLKSIVKLGASWDGNCPDMQLGPDGKIYSAFYKLYLPNNLFCVDVINKPNIPGKGCNYDTLGLRLADSTWSREMPFSMPEYIPEDIKIAHNSVCVGDTLRLSAKFMDGASYEWSGPDGFVDSTQNPVIAPAKLSSSGLYRVIGRYGYGYRVAEDSITVNPLPQPVISGSLELCPRDSLVLHVSQTYSAYEWSSGSESDSTTVKMPGKYSVTVTNNNGCKGTATVEVKALPEINPEITGQSSVCTNAEKEYEIQLKINTRIDWQVTGGALISGKAKEKINVQWGGVGIGKITVTQTDTITGCSGTDTMIVVINDSLKPKITATKNALCKGEILKLSASDGYEKYLWNTGDTTKEILTGKSGEYSVWVKDESGCTGTSDKIIIIDAPSPQPSIAGDTLFCAGTANTLICRGDFVSYNWSTGEITKQISVSQPGTYFLTVTDTNGCSGSASIEVKNYIVNITGLQDLNFGKINYGKSDTILLTCKNESNTPISIKNVYLQKNSPEFSILTKPALPAMLAVNQTIDVTIVFTPKENKASTDSIIAKLDLPCQKVLSSFLSGETASGETYVWLPDTTGTVGEKDFCIPLKASVTQPFAQTGSFGFSAVIKFGATALLPDSIYVSYLIDGVRFVELSDSNVTFQNGTAKLGEFCGTILLANQDLTPVYIDKFGWNQPGIETAKKDGSLSLTGICARNISRIILFDNGALTISPNPANDYINISVGANGCSPESIKIFDVFGQEYLTPTLSTSGEGARIDVSSLSPGVYFVRFGEKVRKFIKY